MPTAIQSGRSCKNNFTTSHPQDLQGSGALKVHMLLNVLVMISKPFSYNLFLEGTRAEAKELASSEGDVGVRVVHEVQLSIRSAVAKHICMGRALANAQKPAGGATATQKITN